MLRYVFDASAILAMLQQEPGSEDATSLLSEGCITSANLSEVIAKLTQKSVPRHIVDDVIEKLGLPVLDISEQIGRRAGFLIAETQPLGLSLGDRLCLAAALENDLKAVTADRSWLNVQNGQNVISIR